MRLRICDGAGERILLATRELVEEVYDLVERELPEVDVDRLRSIFRWQRHEWDAPPPVGFPALD